VNWKEDGVPGALADTYTLPGRRDTDPNPTSGSCGKFAELMGNIQRDSTMIGVLALSAASDDTLSQE
jgi:hypothetical protein